MKLLLQKIKMILKNRRFRRLWYRTVGLVSAVVVFIATYALVLPAITLDVSTASMEPGIVFEQAQYRTPASNVTVAAAENTSEETSMETAAEEVQVEEPEQEEPQAPAEEAAPEETEASEEETSAEAASVEEEPQTETSSGDTQEEAAPEETETSKEETSAEAAPVEEEPQTEQTEGAPAEQPGTTEEAAAAATEQAAEFQIPELSELDFDEILTDRTGFYYYHNENADAEESVSSDSVDDWKKADADTVLAPADFVRVYLPYEIPAGALNETNQTAHFRLPGNLHITDKQVRAINKFENGIYKETRDSKYLGAEAIEGTRTPDEKLHDGEEEYISALVKVDNLSDGGQNLVFTFTPYTIGKNQTAYDQDGQVTAEGQKVKGWFTVDFTVDQIDWNVTDESTETVEAAESSNGSDTEAKTVTATTKKAEIEFTEDKKVVLTLVEKKETAAEAAGQTAMPAQNFEETVTVKTGKVSDEQTMEAAEALPGKDKLTVRVEAEEGTFPEGTTMKVTPIRGSKLEEVGAAAADAVDGTACGYQAVDISFINAEGKEIEPAKAIRVTMTSDSIAKAAEAEKISASPAVVHVADDGNAEANNNIISDPASDSKDAVADSVVFEADQFSTYVLVYTVDFEYTVNGKVYRFSIPGNATVRLSDLIEELGTRDETKYETVSDFISQIEDVQFSDESLVKVTRISNDWQLESLQPFDTEETLTITMKDGTVITVKVTDAQNNDNFTVTVEFKNAQGQIEQPSNNDLSVYIAAKMPDQSDSNNERIYWYVGAINPNNGRAEISVSQLTRQNARPDSYSIKDIIDASKSIEVKLLKSGYSIEQNNAPRGTILSGEVSNGSVYKGYELSVTTDGQSSAQITAQRPQPYTYTVKAVDKNGNNTNINFTEGPWYLYGEVTRSDGVYFYVKKLEAGSGISGTVDKLEHFSGVNNRQSETVPSTNDFITFALVRPKDSYQSDQPGYFYTSDNMNVKALSGSSVDSKYTLEVVPGQSHSDIILREGSEASIELTSYGENDTLEGSPELNASGSYFIVGELSFRDGLEDKTCYYVKKVDGNQSQTVDISYFTGKNNDIQYLTGTRSFEPVLVFDPSPSATAENVLTKLINNQSGITVYRNEDPVESYRMISVNGTLDEPEGKIRLNKLPTLSAEGETQDKDGNPAPKKDAETYSLLVEITRDGKKAYAYQPLTFDADGKMASVKIADTFKEETSGETWYYREEDTPAFYVVKGNVSDHAAAVASSERYAAGQLMGSYTPSFTFDDETYTVKTVLKEAEVPEGVPYTVRIDMMNKAQNDIELVTPPLSGNYYVLATLTPKGTGAKGQVVAWTTMNVDLSDLNPDGTWNGVIPADGFNVCNANMDSTGTKIGYNADEYDINLRLYHSNTAYTNYNDIIKYADDSAPNGYDFRGVYTKDNDPVTGSLKLLDDNASVIRLHKAYDKEYGVRAYVDNPGLDIPAGEYVVKVKLLHETGNDTYAFAKLKIDPTVGGDTPAELEFYSDYNGRIWRDQNGHLGNGSNFTFTGNEKGVEITLMSLNSNVESFAEWAKDPSQTNTYTVVNPGESINLYTYTQGDREDEENIGEQKHYVYDVLRFTEDVNGISKGELDEKLKQARDFGLYTELLSKHATDMEANIGAAVLSGEIGADYGFSDNNVKVNRITVTKQYYDENGNPANNKQVTLRLYPVETYDENTGNYTLGAKIAEKQGNTNADGTLELVFDKLPAGKYVVKEVLNGKEYDFNYGGSQDGYIQDGNTIIRFKDRFIDIANINVNYNYFGDITDNVSLPPILSHSRHGLIVVGNENDYNALKGANGGEVASDGTTVKKAGEDPDYPLLDIPADMANLRELSNLLGVTANSKTVRVVNTTYEDITANNGLKLKSDGRYIVVNVDMTDAPSVATVNLDTYIDNQRLMADFGAGGNEDSSKVLYNFITKDARGNISNYTGKINTATQAAGVLLAPSAIVADLGGNWGGTIICREAQHTGSEIHSDSANKIQNKNTMLTNGEADKGNLELIKSFAEASDDRTTWFTFKVTAQDADGNPLNGEYKATGLKEGDKVTFVNGEATVLVRAQNKVFIVGLPAGVTYSVEEVDTPETEHYSYDHMIPENGSGTIVRNETSSVEVVNKKNDETCSMIIVKTVEGPVTEAELKGALQFVVEVLDNDDHVVGYLDKDGNVSQQIVTLTPNDGFSIAKDQDGHVTSITKKFDGIAAGKYRVTETNHEIAGYKFVTEQSVTAAETTIEAGKTGRIYVKDVYEDKSFEFSKIWKTVYDQIEEWPSGKTISVTLYSKAGDGAETTVDTFDLTAAGGTGASGRYTFTREQNADNTYTFKITGLPATDENQNEITYYVRETTVADYKDPEYGFKGSDGVIQTKTDGDYAGDKEYVINRPEKAYELPSAGGPGAKLFTILGSMLLLGTGMVLIMRRRRVL